MFAKDAYTHWPGPALILNIIDKLLNSNVSTDFITADHAGCRKCALDEPTANSSWPGQLTSTTKIVLTFVILLSLFALAKFGTPLHQFCVFCFVYLMIK